MKRIKTDRYTYMNGSRAWRLGQISLEREFGDTPFTLVDVDGYGPLLYWESDEYWVTTNWNGEITDITGKIDENVV